MIFEALVCKGLIALGHFAAAHMTAGGIMAVGHALTTLTIGQLATVTVTAGFVAGCVKWTEDRLNNLKKGAKAISDGRYKTAIAEFGQLAISSGLNIDLLPDSVEKALEKLHLDSSTSRKVTSWVKNHELEIAEYVKKNK